MRNDREKGNTVEKFNEENLEATKQAVPVNQSNDFAKNDEQIKKVKLKHTVAIFSMERMQALSTLLTNSVESVLQKVISEKMDCILQNAFEDVLDRKLQEVFEGATQGIRMFSESMTDKTLIQNIMQEKIENMLQMDSLPIQQCESENDVTGNEVSKNLTEIKNDLIQEDTLNEEKDKHEQLSLNDNEIQEEHEFNGKQKEESDTETKRTPNKWNLLKMEVAKQKYTDYAHKIINILKTHNEPLTILQVKEEILNVYNIEWVNPYGEIDKVLECSGDLIVVTIQGRRKYFSFNHDISSANDELHKNINTQT